MCAKWRNSFDYYAPGIEWAADQWAHVAFTWAAGQGIRAYLNGCDMDADDSKGYASTKGRRKAFAQWYTFQLGAAAGTTVDELYIWHDLLNSHQIWQFYIQGATVWLCTCFILYVLWWFCWGLYESYSSRLLHLYWDKSGISYSNGSVQNLQDIGHKVRVLLAMIWPKHSKTQENSPHILWDA